MKLTIIVVVVLTYVAANAHAASSDRVFGIFMGLQPVAIS